jgi:hypothetical protein
VRTYASVARAYDLSIRIDNLTFNHHRIAMAVEPKDRIDWLVRALHEDWSVADLRRQIRQAKNRFRPIAGPSGGEQQSDREGNRRGPPNDQQRYWRKVAI